MGCRKNEKDFTCQESREKRENNQQSDMLKIHRYEDDENISIHQGTHQLCDLTIERSAVSRYGRFHHLSQSIMIIVGV